MRCTVATPSSTAFAIARAVQWVASCGGGACVSRTTSAVLPAGIGALPGGRVLSRSRPAIPASANRSCQRQTVVFDLPVAAMMARVPRPSAVSRTIRARQTCFWAAFRSATITASRRRSAAETPMEIPVRMTQIRTEGTRRESQIGLFRLGQSTRTAAIGARGLKSPNGFAPLKKQASTIMGRFASLWPIRTGDAGRCRRDIQHRRSAITGLYQKRLTDRESGPKRAFTTAARLGPSHMTPPSAPSL